jgi:hypothetical protein
MSERPAFEGYPLKTRAFYNRILWMMWLNLEATRHGYFDVLLSDTEDPFTWFRFVEAIPDIKLWLDIDNDIGNV